MADRSYSSAAIPYGQKIAELLTLARMRWRQTYNPAVLQERIVHVFDDIREYGHYLARYGHGVLSEAKVLEIGFGARPLRLIALVSLGVDARGVDVDVPVLQGTPREFLEMHRRNGGERALKSLVRFFCFDLMERRYLVKELERHHRKCVIAPERFLVEDATALEMEAHSLDLIFSEDVFEHIPPEALQKLVAKMARWLKPEGLALIRPNVFTGIAGGHLAEWFPEVVRAHSGPVKSEPWEHLRKKRYRANTYLNHLSRAQYRPLFSAHFSLLEERVKDPDLGREFLVGEAAQDLAGYAEEELFSNQVLFVLRPLRVAIP